MNFPRPAKWGAGQAGIHLLNCDPMPLTESNVCMFQKSLETQSLIAKMITQTVKEMEGNKSDQDKIENADQQMPVPSPGDTEVPWLMKWSTIDGFLKNPSAPGGAGLRRLSREEPKNFLFYRHIPLASLPAFEVFICEHLFWSVPL